MNRRQLERHLRTHGCQLHHHGGKHDVWVNPSNLAQAPVPRHGRIKRGTVRGICRILGIPRPPGI
jgi:mRNA interferase HicA